MGAARAEQRSGEEGGEEGRMEKGKWKKRKEKKKKKKKKRGERGKRERFVANLSASTTMPDSRARAAVAAACCGFGGKWRARIEGNRGTEWRLDPGVGTGEKISGVRVQVLGGFELNDEKFFKGIF